MFNNRLFKIALTEDENYFYESLRDDKNLDPSEYLHRYYNYLNNVHFLDGEKKDSAMTFATELAAKPELVNLLDSLIYYTSWYKLSDSQLLNLYNNFDDALYRYAVSNTKYIAWFQKPEGLEYSRIQDFRKETSEDKKKLFFNQNKNLFILENGGTAETLETTFRYVIKLINKIVEIENGDLELSLSLIDFYITPSAHVAPLVPTSYGEVYSQKKKTVSGSVAEVILDFINEDIDNRLEIVKSLRSIGAFSDLVTEKYPELFNRLLNIDVRLSRFSTSFKIKDVRDIIKNKLYPPTNNSKDNSKDNPSKHFQEFKLPNSSNEERKIFDDLERLGLYAIPAKQRGNINLIDDEGQKFAFRIDFLLPCNVREYDGETFTLRSDIVFVGEYFGYYGSDYERKKIRKIQWQNNLENSLDQRCLHIEPGSNLCSVLKEKNIDSKCYPDFGKELYSVNNINQKKTFYVKSQIQHFLYQYLVNELLWEINYDYNFNTMDNYNRVKENNGVFLDRFEKLLLDVEKHNPEYLVKECADIVESYKKNFARKKRLGNRNLRTSKVYNYRKNPSN